MRTDRILIVLTGLANAAISIYADRTSASQSPSLDFEISFVLGCAVFPAGMMFLPTVGRTKSSDFIVTCAVATLLSGGLFTYMYVAAQDSSRIFIMGVHWLLTWVFAFSSLFSSTEKNVS